MKVGWCLSFLLLQGHTTAKATCRREFIWGFRGRESMTIMAGRMAVGRHGTGTVVKSLYLIIMRLIIIIIIIIIILYIILLLLLYYEIIIIINEFNICLGFTVSGQFGLQSDTLSQAKQNITPFLFTQH